MNLASYIAMIDDRFRHDGFDLEDESENKDLGIVLAAFSEKLGFALTSAPRKKMAFVISCPDSTTPDTLARFATSAYELAMKRPSGTIAYSGHYVFPTLVSDSFGRETIEFVRKFPTKLAPDRFNHPVLVELGSESIYHRERRPIWGAAQFGYVRKTAERYLSFG